VLHLVVDGSRQRAIPEMIVLASNPIHVDKLDRLRRLEDTWTELDGTINNSEMILVEMIVTVVVIYLIGHINIRSSAWSKEDANRAFRVIPRRGQSVINRNQSEVVDREVWTCPEEAEKAGISMRAAQPNHGIAQFVSLFKNVVPLTRHSSVWHQRILHMLIQYGELNTQMTGSDRAEILEERVSVASLMVYVMSHQLPSGSGP
jgi:hypothetical protein